MLDLQIIWILIYLVDEKNEIEMEKATRSYL